MHVASPSPPAQCAAGFGIHPLPAAAPRIRPRPHQRPHAVGGVWEQPHAATPPAGVLADGSQPSSPVPNTWQSGTKEADYSKVLYGDN